MLFSACSRVPRWSHRPAGWHFQWGRESTEGWQRIEKWKMRIDFCCFTTYSILNEPVCVCTDLCGGAMQQREHRFAVRDGPCVSDPGLRPAVIPGLQCGGLVPLTSLLPPQPVSTRHKHAGPVPGKMTGPKKSLWSQHTLSMWSDAPCPDCSRAISLVAEPPLLVW